MNEPSNPAVPVPNQNMQPAPQVPAPAPVQQQQPAQEPLVPQHKVNELISEALQRGREKGAREASANTNPSANHDDYRRIAQEEFAKAQAQLAQQVQKQHEEKIGRDALDQITKKMSDAATRYPDYDDKVRALKLETMPDVLWYANTVENGGDVLHDLAENPAKIGMIRSLPPHLAQMEIKKLSDSIKLNQNAKTNTNLPNEPFHQIKSTGSGVDKRPSDRSPAEWAKHYKGKF